jgi:sigma54-dependent transcription regulator
VGQNVNRSRVQRHNYILKTSKASDPGIHRMLTVLSTASSLDKNEKIELDRLDEEIGRCRKNWDIAVAAAFASTDPDNQDLYPTAYWRKRVDRMVALRSQVKRCFQVWRADRLAKDVKTRSEPPRKRKAEEGRGGNADLGSSRGRGMGGKLDSKRGSADGGGGGAGVEGRRR